MAGRLATEISRPGEDSYSSYNDQFSFVI